MNEKTTDRRLRKTYGISLADYIEMAAKQNGVCGICGKPPGTRRLHVDHDHSVHKTNIRYRKLVHNISDGLQSSSWEASADYKGKRYEGFGMYKREAKKEVVGFLRRASVRGLLCWRPCNHGLAAWNDRPDLLEAAAKYLRKFEEKK